MKYRIFFYIFVLILGFVSFNFSATAAKLEPDANGVYREAPVIPPPADTKPNVSENIQRTPDPESLQAPSNTDTPAETVGNPPVNPEVTCENPNGCAPTAEKKGSVYPFVIISIIFIILTLAGLFITTKAKSNS